MAEKTASDIFERIRREAHAGQLAAGQTLPSVREMADQLGVNRNTVAAAYRKLVAAGIAETLGRNGTVIRPAARLGEQEGLQPGSALADLASGNPDPAWLPDPLQALAASGYRPALYGQPVLDPALERLARQWFGADLREGDGLVLAHGAVDAIERLLAAYLVAGDKVAVEDPCFLGSLNILHSTGLAAVPVAMDAHGMRPQALEAALANGAQAVLCTPRAQNPTGCGLSEQRARELRRVLARHPHVLVIEDDHFALLAETPYFSIAPAYHAAGAGALRVQGLRPGPAAGLHRYRCGDRRKARHATGSRHDLGQPPAAGGRARPARIGCVQGAPACGQGRLRHASQGPDRCARRRGHRRQAALRRVQCVDSVAGRP